MQRQPQPCQGLFVNASTDVRAIGDIHGGSGNLKMNRYGCKMNGKGGKDCKYFLRRNHAIFPHFPIRQQQRHSLPFLLTNYKSTGINPETREPTDH